MELNFNIILELVLSLSNVLYRGFFYGKSQYLKISVVAFYNCTRKVNITVVVAIDRVRMVEFWSR